MSTPCQKESVAKSTLSLSFLKASRRLALSSSPCFIIRPSNPFNMVFTVENAHFNDSYDVKRTRVLPCAALIS